MKIIATDIHKKFRQEWVFKSLNYTFESGKSYAIVGQNGAGKSTLLKTLAQYALPNKGTVEFEGHTTDVNKLISFAAPYSELIEEFTLTEVLNFHFQFKNRIANLNNKDLIALLDMESSKNKELKYFSSGMKQRVKLVLAFCSNTSILLLDEPTANLDEQGINWYKELVNKFSNNRLVIVCSNQSHEYEFCKHQIQIADYKN